MSAVDAVLSTSTRRSILSMTRLLVTSNGGNWRLGAGCATVGEEQPPGLTTHSAARTARTTTLLVKTATQGHPSTRRAARCGPENMGFPRLPLSTAVAIARATLASGPPAAAPAVSHVASVARAQENAKAPCDVD